MDLSEQTLRALDWAVVLEALAGQARTVMGARVATRLEPLDEVDAVRAAHDAIDELTWIEEEGGDVPVGAVGDIAALVRRAAKGEVLDPAGLLEASRTLDALDELARRLLGLDEECPTLAGIAAGISLDPELCDTLSRAFDETGRLSARTYPLLEDLRRAITDLHASIRATLDELLRGEELADVLQDRFVTQRNDRYVLPIKAHAKRWDIGIVHGASGSGATVFVEPRQVVEINNRLRLAEAALQAEERRILTALSRLLGAHLEAIGDGLAAALEIDLAVARRGLARSLEAQRPRVGREGVIHLRGARHPVLSLRGIEVVPNDLALDSGHPVLVITGPNTGGKTVALKTMGLCALLVGIGCFVPAASGSRVDLFDDILADIGDSQTVQEDLSSFSAHLLVLRQMLARAAPHHLFLLDEMATGTDPAQGSALARAVLESLAERGPRVVVTTHYAALKALAAADPRFSIAAMEYQEGRPTYRSIPGATGESHALATAVRLGLEESVVDRATELMGHNERALTAALEALDEQRARAEAEARRAARATAQLEAGRAALEAREARVAARARELEEQAAAAYLGRLRKAEEAIREVVAELQRDPSHRKVAAARASVAALKELAPVREPPPGLPPDQLSLGDRVRLRTLGREGEVIALGDGKVTVRAGGVSVRVRPEELVVLSRPAPPPQRRRVRSTGSGTADPAQAVRLPDNTLDMRGMRVDEGIAAAEQFFDRALLEDRDIVFLLHGHGTGKLKRGLRGWLSSCAYVHRWRPADAEQGGDAFTVVAVRHA